MSDKIESLTVTQAMRLKKLADTNLELQEVLRGVDLDKVIADKRNNYPTSKKRLPKEFPANPA